MTACRRRFVPPRATGRVTLLVVTTLLLLSGAAVPAATPLRILMLGNSYTDLGSYDYNVWQQLQNFLNADRTYVATVSRRAPGGWQLYQHANAARFPNRFYRIVSP